MPADFTVAFYLHLLAKQNPFPIGTDEVDRAMYSFNLDAMGYEITDTWLADLITLLQSASPALPVTLTPDTNLFIGTTVKLPEPQFTDPLVTLLNTGGMSAYSTHGGEQLDRLSVQFIIRGLNSATVSTLAAAIHSTLDHRFNLTIP